MKPLLWRVVAFIVCRPIITEWLVRIAKRTPYTHIYSPDRWKVYMYRFWLFNPYNGYIAKWGWLPSIRIHHIMVPDHDRHCHDHPWIVARTFILSGWYEEERLLWYSDTAEPVHVNYPRLPGATAELKHGDYHRISRVSPGGVWTLFITWKYQGPWGFWVDGKKVPYREYHQS